MRLTRNHRLHDKSPCADVPRSNDVGVRGKAAPPTSKLGLTLSVASVAVSALWTCAAGVLWINYTHLDARQLCLVLDKRSKLEERPSAHLSSLPLAKPCPLANALEVFKGNSAFGAFSLGNKLLADAVVDVLPESSLSSCDAPQSSPCATRPLASVLLESSYLLQLRSPLQIVRASRFDNLATILFSGAIGGDIGQAEINANKVAGRNLRSVWKVGRNEKEPSVVPEDQIGLAFGVAESFALILPHDERHKHAAIQGYQADAVNALERHDALVIRHCGIRSERRLLGFISLVRFADLRDAAHCHLRWETETIAHLAVEQLLQENLICRLATEGFSGQPVRRLVKALDHGLKAGTLIRCRHKFKLKC